MANRSDVELLTAEYIEEVVKAGGARYMTADDLGEFISELVLGNFAPLEQKGLADFARNTAHMMLLPEECRKRGVMIDQETAEMLRDVLSVRDPG